MKYQPYSRYNCISHEREGEFTALINSLSYYVAANIKHSHKRISERKAEGQRDVFRVLFLFISLSLFVRFSIIPFPLDTSFHISLTSLDTDKLIITFDCVVPQCIMVKQSTFRVNVPFQRVRAKWGLKLSVCL